VTDLPRSQHVIASGLVAAVGVWVAYVSYTAEPAEAFLFPRIISSVFLILSVWTFGKAVAGRTKVGNGLSAAAIKNILPGLFVALIYVFWAAETLGFYTASAIAFFVLLCLYDPAPTARPRHGSSGSSSQQAFWGSCMASLRCS